MITFRQFFHYISYLQYPLMFTALYFAFKPLLDGLEDLKHNPIYFESINSMLIFMGLGMSFSSLQDTTKTQNKFSRKIYEDPKKGKALIFIIILMIACYLGIGLIGFFSAKNKIISEISVGLIILALGMFSFLKAGVEMYENHRLDKNTDVNKH